MAKMSIALVDKVTSEIRNVAKGIPSQSIYFTPNDLKPTKI